MKRPVQVLVSEVASIFAQGQKDFDNGKGNLDGTIKAETSLRGELYEAYLEDSYLLRKLLAEQDLRLLEVPNSNGEYGMVLLAIDNFYLEKEDQPLTLVFYSSGEVFGKDEERFTPEASSELRKVILLSASSSWLNNIKHLLLRS